ncbi:protease HtpX [Candidatus Gracilibacteria bacterium]|nr:protease HtpX [Candidatus Gracilibacteria bacterium]
MIQRVLLFLVTNIAVIVMFSVILFLVERFFGINLSAYGQGYMGLLIFASIFGFVGAFISLAMSKSAAKRAYKIKPITSDQVSGLNKKQRLVYNTVQELADRNHITMPEVGFYNAKEANAFATGATKNSSLVAVSSGLLDSMPEDAIEGVVAHEMAHILNGDMVTMTLLQGIMNTFVIFFARVAAGAIESYLNKGEKRSGPSFIYYILSIVLEIIFGILASMITMWFSRHREYRADAGSAQYVGKHKMIAGLRALIDMQSRTSIKKGNFSTMKISSRKPHGIRRLFSSHPPLEDRIKAIEDMIIQ